ncbi:hypothetical protein F4778DRAFT_771740 [Xylariomycetidae sp. FL2044]|nr:hypothetical protein F4778DRAFT_771740 [Xylariomycetidae sp. FL2044]
MAHAWLDSLSEDWVSQPGSDASQSQLPVFSSSRATSNAKSTREQASRIPRFSVGNPTSRKPQPVALESPAHILNERSLNEINSRSLPRQPSQLSHGLKSTNRGRRFSRSVSASTAGSVIHNTVQHNKSQSNSPSKGQSHVPEWKRRLLYGELNYGESKDLFSSAGTGLENMFKPPVAPASLGEEMTRNEDYETNETTLPSSPPPYAHHRQHDSPLDDSLEQSGGAANESAIPPPAKAPKPITFRRTDDDTVDISSQDETTYEGTGTGQEAGTNTPTGTLATSLTARVALDASRKTSGQSIMKNEDLSPILLSRHNSESGKISFAPIELPSQQLRKRLEQLRRNQMVLDPEPGSTVTHEYVAPADGSQRFENTEDFAEIGGFVNTRRGGLSAEGSFRRRPLSPPLTTDTSEMLPESSLQASTPKQFPTVRTDRYASASDRSDPRTPPSPVMPRAPHPSPEKRLQPPPGHSGSPLKLFGPYDTFTNQTLLRRISQFEDQMSNSPPHSSQDSTAGLPMQSPSKSDLNKAFLNGTSPQKGVQVSHGHHETFGAVNNFGEGELDGYEFSGDISLAPSDNSQSEDKENMTPERERTPPSDPLKFDIHEDITSDSGSVIVQRRHKPSSSVSSRHSTRLSKSPYNIGPKYSSGPNRSVFGVHGTPQRDGSEGKRPRTSPSKDPTPKRRRTLHRSDIAYGLEDRPDAIETVQSTHYHMQSAMSRKRSGGWQGETSPPANPNVLAMREILRPRSPTPSQRSPLTRDRQPLADLDTHQDDGEVRSSVQDRHSEILVQDFAIDGSRKTSMRTQDFFDAAEEIMAMIRNKARPKNDLASVEESEEDSGEQRSTIGIASMEDSFQESTREPFSRPPSREGRPLSRMPVRQEDPQLVDLLKQYQEGSELGDIITTSLKSMERIKEAIHETNNVTESIHQSIRASSEPASDLLSGSQEEIISDLPNVRISRNPNLSDAGEKIEFPSNGSRSSGSSTARSVPTGSSGGSDSRRLIAPDAVTQLIGEQVGNMVFDKHNKVWMKVKTPKPISRRSNILPSEDSEDDPFASIPDLSVDTFREKQNLALPNAPSLEDLKDFLQDGSSPKESRIQLNGDGQSPDTKSIMSHTKETFMRIRQTLVETAVEDDEEIEHEITLHEDRMHNSTPSRRRGLTITFSSPIASIIQDVAHHASEDDSADCDPTEPNTSIGSIAADSLRRGRYTSSSQFTSSTTTKSKSRSRSRGIPRSMSVRRQAFATRPVSRIDERDEDSSGDHNASREQRQISIRGDSSIVAPDPDDKPNRSLSFVVSTPAPNRTADTSVTEIIGHYVGNLSLSPLSEFTVHQADQSRALEVSYVVGDKYLVTGDGSKDVMSKAIRNLVEKITDVEPFEPDWDSMRELDISDKSLATLHKLDEFCSSVVTLDASNNSICHLDGVPSSVRNLRMTHNHLSELTAWNQLMNLQYVDISNNQISSLHAFKDLVHLRTLRADNNQITSLDGIRLHDSLQVLRVRGNLIDRVDFDGTKLQHLTELNLEGNQITSIQNIEQLPSLTTLNVQRNRLKVIGTTSNNAMACLKYLKLSDNDLITMDVSVFPSLRLLHADRNQLTSLAGFSRCRRLDSLSLREQRGDVPLDLSSFLHSVYEVRKLFLSGNLLGAFAPRVDFLNLQYLELANCGLEALAPDLGQLLPNLRVFNLNFNAVADLAPLRYVPRLKKLLAAGNRLADARKAADVLAGFPHLVRLDLRDNPATHGFYPPIQSLVAPVVGNDEAAAVEDPFTLPDVEVERDDRFSSRVDMGSRMRRRLFEMVVTGRCARLKALDGLPVSRDRVAQTDAVYRALVRSGVISESEGRNTEDYYYY